MSDYDYYDINTGEGIDTYKLEEWYDDMLDGAYGDFMDSYPASRVLKQVDPIAYQVGFNDYVDSLIDETITEDAPEADNTGD